MNQKFDLQVALEKQTSGKSVRLHMILFKGGRKFEILKRRAERSGVVEVQGSTIVAQSPCLGNLYIKCKSCDELLLMECTHSSLILEMLPVIGLLGNMIFVRILTR